MEQCLSPVVVTSGQCREIAEKLVGQVFSANDVLHGVPTAPTSEKWADLLHAAEVERLKQLQARPGRRLEPEPRSKPLATLFGAGD